MHDCYILQTACGNFTKFTTSMQLVTEMNSTGFWSQQVMKRPNMVENHLFKNLTLQQRYTGQWYAMRDYLYCISQLPKLCKRIEHWCIEYLLFILWVRSFSTRLPTVIFAEEKVLIFLILHEKCYNSATLSLTLILTQFPEQIDQINWSGILSNGTLFSTNLVQ